MGKINCPLCPKVLDSEFEFRLHWQHSHRGPMPAPKLVIDASPVAVVEEHESGHEYALATSKEGLGELCPVLKDHFGNIIDGYHRKGENANWREETCDWIDTPEKLEAARLAVNFARRDMAPEEIKERITHLVKSGLKVEEIAKLTGISERTVLKYMPQEFKDQKKVDAGRTPKTNVNSAEALQHTVRMPDNIPATTGDCTPRVRTFAEAAAEVASKTSEVGESSFVPGEVEEEEVVPDGYPLCPCCGASMDIAEYKEVKQTVARKFGKPIQTLLFPEED
jgi:transposase-like protein